MCLFIKKNWKFLLFPILVFFILIFDFIIGINYTITVFKILFLSLIHYFFVLRTKYVFESELIDYYARLKLEYESNKIMYPLLTPLMSKLLFWIFIIGSMSLTFLTFIQLQTIQIITPLWYLFFFGLFFFDLTTEVACFYTSKKYVSKVFIPKSVSNYRLFSGIVSTTVKIGPLCSKLGSFIVAGLGFTEFGYPMATGGLNEPGVLTKVYMNNKYYDDLSFPIKTRADICYENAWHGYEEDVQAGARSENPLKKRTYSIRTVKDLVPLGMSEKDKHIIFPNLSSD